MTTTTIVGTAGRDPELRFTASGQATCKFGVAVNRKWTDKRTNEQQESTSWFDVQCWGQLAENVAESISKGQRVVVTGRLDIRPWEAEDGTKRIAVELTADAIGPDLRWATAHVTKNERRDNVDQGARSAPVPNTAPAGYDEEPFACVVGMTDDVPQPLRRALLA